uniref:ATP synthase F0 subunit 8 n=1 Tax=Siphonaria pectinata TaxID=57642 RepID=B3DFE1_9GAST|nr:ATP synthase F0 subunit 8 [Siphonaria pectinata]ACE62828.1 ATP synthase F0 subunit 8 [Siphonaria pectinata]
MPQLSPAAGALIYLFILSMFLVVLISNATLKNTSVKPVKSNLLKKKLSI